jgi:hypothetical protein
MNKVKKSVILMFICTGALLAMTSSAQTLNYDIDADLMSHKKVCDGFGICTDGKGKMEILYKGLFCYEILQLDDKNWYQIAQITDINESASISNGMLQNATYVTARISGECPLWGLNKDINK